MKKDQWTNHIYFKPGASASLTYVCLKVPQIGMPTHIKNAIFDAGRGMEPLLILGPMRRSTTVPERRTCSILTLASHSTYLYYFYIIHPPVKIIADCIRLYGRLHQ